jgi:hypothetical protein
MTTEELRIEIHKRLDNLPDKALPDFLEYLRHLIYTQPVSADMEKLQKSIDNIFDKNATLLKKLADG